MQIRPALFICILVLLFCFGCATTPREIVSPPEPPAEEIITPPQAPEPQPPPTQEEAETVIEPEAPVAPPEETPLPRSTVPETVKTDKTASRALASLKLTEQARLMIESKKPDDAIRTLERAMNIDSGNGQNYYYLAEAWILKGNRAQAIEFNRMAEIYLGNDGGWNARVQQQKGRIEKMN